MKTIVILCVLLLAVGAFSQDIATINKKFGDANTASLPKEEADILANLQLLRLTAEKCGRPILLDAGNAECKDLDVNLAQTYEKIVRYPRLVRILAAEAVNKRQRLAPDAVSAMQITELVDRQNAELMPLLIIQNQRIIELLEQIAKKPK